MVLLYDWRIQRCRGQERKANILFLMSVPISCSLTKIDPMCRLKSLQLHHVISTEFRKIGYQLFSIKRTFQFFWFVHKVNCTPARGLSKPCLYTAWFCDGFNVAASLISRYPHHNPMHDFVTYTAWYTGTDGSDHSGGVSSVLVMPILIRQFPIGLFQAYQLNMDSDSVKLYKRPCRKPKLSYRGQSSHWAKQALLTTTLWSKTRQLQTNELQTMANSYKSILLAEQLLKRCSLLGVLVKIEKSLDKTSVLEKIESKGQSRASALLLLSPKLHGSSEERRVSAKST